MTANLFSRLERELGAAAVLSPDDARYADYSRDEGVRVDSAPDAVVLPTTETMVQTVLAIARETNTPVTPRGAGSG